MAMGIERMMKLGKIKVNPLKSQVAAISVGIVSGIPMLDLKYTEDSSAEVDMNVVMNDKGEFIEVQGTGEEATYSRKELNELLDLAEIGLKELFEIQTQTLNDEFSTFE